MATRNPTHRFARTDQPSDIGPAVTFAATVLVTFAALAAAAATLPRDAIMPAVSLLFFMFAGITALAAWRLGQNPASPRPLLLRRGRRAHLCAAPGHVLIGADFSAIQSRGRGWRARSKMASLTDGAGPRRP